MVNEENVSEIKQPPAPKHVHKPEHWPSSGSGYAICECGASIRVKNGYPEGGWHTCALCTHDFGR